MKNSISLTAMIWLLIALLQTGCAKYLEEKGDSSLVVPSTLEDLQGLLDDATIMNSGTAALGACSADDYFLESATYESKNIFSRSVYTWQPYPYRYINDWSAAYSAVYNANLCLEKIGNIQSAPVQQPEWNNVKGSALFYRAYYFLELSWLFSVAYDTATAIMDKGIVLRTGTDFNIRSVRSSVQACYDKILGDAKEAAGYLPLQQANSTRPSRCAAYGLLARTYLSMRLYDSAFAYADMALQINDGLMDYNDPFVADINTFYRFKRTNAETIFYSTMNFYTSLYHPMFGGARIDTILLASYADNDLRKALFFAPAGNYQQFRGNYAATYGLFSGIATDELLLMRAECAARMGNDIIAMADMNRLLNNRYRTGTFLPLSGMDNRGLINLVLSERRKELLCRGSLRWMDIKRLNKDGAEIILTRKIDEEEYRLLPNDKRYALPLPQDVIESSGIEQN